MRYPSQPSFVSFRLISGLLAGAALALAGPSALASPGEAATPQATPVSAPGAAAGANGLKIYNEVCIACHAAPGIGGAPALGDGEAWAPRLAQGHATLIDHALNGFSGSAGIMPRKGGRIDLSDEEIIAAVEYMVEQVAP